jgi:uncharacterized protein YjaG (DUF416 family)
MGGGEMNTPSQIAVDAAKRFAFDSGRTEERLSEAIQSAIDKATAGMVPIEDVKPLLEAILHGTIERQLMERDAFISKHGDKLK